MPLPLEETTPLTEVIESTVDRITESMLVLGTLAERAVSDATRRNPPDTAVVALSTARFWSAWVEQAALGAQRLAGNLVLLTHDTLPPVEWESQTPIVMATNPPDAGCYFRAVDVICSDGRPITDGEIRFKERGGEATITVTQPATQNGWGGELTMVVKTFGWVPTGPISGSVQAFDAATHSPHGPAVPIYCALG